MATIKTCEEYVLQELYLYQAKLEIAEKEKDEYRRLYNQSETENDKLRMQLREAQEVINNYQK